MFHSFKSISDNSFLVYIEFGQCYNNSRISKYNVGLGCLSTLSTKSYPTSQNVIGIQGSLQVQSASSEQQWREYL